MTKICVENPFKFECPIIIKDVRIIKMPNDFENTEIIFPKNADIVIKKKPAIKSIADFPDRVSKDNFNNDKSTMLNKSPPKFPATDKKTKNPAIKPSIANFFIRFSE